MIKKTKKEINKLIDEFDLIIEVLDDFYEDQRDHIITITEAPKDGATKHVYHTSKLDDLKRLYIDTSMMDKDDVDFKDRVEYFMEHFIYNPILCQSISYLIWWQILNIKMDISEEKKLKKELI